ncbi:MAG: aminotransferase class I/II-fold pyridoxal phosphate-dependent enzyme [Prevotellaceae bacterium]|nr:aminotransferase class I/II-fold pyridoxal phosphate-dependent enzyme [Prevotellaceae bacterium]
MNYTLRDFSLDALPTNVLDRAKQFKKWIAESEVNPVYWIESQNGVKPEMILKNKNTNTTQTFISFISSDYLGMSQHPETIQAGIDALRKYGTGACASPMIGGYLDIHKQLEEEIADFTGQEAAMVFSSGFSANVGVLNALLGKDDIAYIDLQTHRSVLDGLFNTNIKKIGHNNVEYLKFVLEKDRHKYKTSIVIIDGVYSQDGDIAPLSEIIALCKEFNTMIYMDDAHGMGVFGANGRGVAEHFGMLGRIDIITGALSKSFGAVGGYVAASKDIINYLKFYANTSIFSGSPAPQPICSVLKAIELIRTDKNILKKLWDNTYYLRKRLTEESFDIKQTISPIFPIMVRDPYEVAEAVRLLRERNIYVCGVSYPAVTNKEARIRISLSASHEIKHLDTLVDALCEIDKELHIRRT